MDWHHFKRWGRDVVLAGIIGFCLAGCAAQPAVDEPISLQLSRNEPGLKGHRFNVLLDFESSRDLAFVRVNQGAADRDTTGGHTGRSGLVVPAGSAGMTAEVGKLVSVGALQGTWVLAGAWFCFEEPVDVTVTQQSNPRGNTSRVRTVHVEPGKWTGVFLDIQGVVVAGTAMSTEAGPLEFTFSKKLSRPGRVDDVAVIDNTQVLVQVPDGWTIRRRGYRFQIDNPNQFGFELPSAEGSPEGWAVDEANSLRARFHRGSGAIAHRLTIYADGRAYQDGTYRSLRPILEKEAMEYAAQHRSPGEISVPEEQGTVRRDTPGDANNDGYNELLGAYQVKAIGPRLDVTFEPGLPVINPVLEIVGLPPGNLLVSVEGQQINHALRLTDGRVLLRLPIRLERPTTVNIRLE